LAEELQISRRHFYRWLEELQLLGLEIEYNREIKSYVYLKSYQIMIKFDIRELTVQETTEIEAGINIMKKNPFEPLNETKAKYI